VLKLRRLSTQPKNKALVSISSKSKARNNSLSKSSMVELPSRRNNLKGKSKNWLKEFQLLKIIKKKFKGNKSLLSQNLISKKPYLNRKLSSSKRLLRTQTEEKRKFQLSSKTARRTSLTKIKNKLHNLKSKSRTKTSWSKILRKQTMSKKRKSLISKF